MTREPDRFDCHECGVGVKVDEDGCCASCGRDAIEVEGGLPVGPLRDAYTRAAEASALERAAQVLHAEATNQDRYAARAAFSEAENMVRALIPPAAAPAADYDPITAPIPEGDMNGPHGPLPAAETEKAPAPSDEFYDALADGDWPRVAAEMEKAQGAETRCHFNEQDCLDASQLLRECEEALSAVGCHPDGEALAQAVLKKLRARAAPSEGEGK